MIIVWSLLGVLGALVLVFIIFYLILLSKNPNPEKPQKIKNETGYVSAIGRNIYDENGNLLLLRGVNFGNWFDQEYWMTVSSVGSFETGIYTQKRALKAMNVNPNLTEEDIEELNKLYIDEYIKEEDFKEIADLNLNCVRINFTCYNLTTDGYKIKDDAFIKIDWALDMCEKYGLYAILDYHGAIGSQNMDIHSGNDEEFALYGNEKNEDATKEIWRTIARRYKGRKVIAAFDLLNEPRRAPNKFTGKINFDFYDELYKVVREEDKDRMLIMECFTFPTHGVNEKKYGWKNICISYHYYNHTPFSERFGINFYKATHNLMGYNTAVIIGEFSVWSKEKGWHQAIDMFEKMGWSHLSWTYKANRYTYKHGVNDGDMLKKKFNLWGLFELDLIPVDLSTAKKEEIKEKYKKVGTKNAEKTVIYNVYKDRYGNKLKKEKEVNAL